MSLFPPSVYRVPRRERRARQRAARALVVDPVEYQIELISIRWYGTSTSYSWVPLRECVLIDSSRWVNPTYYFEAILMIDNAAATAYARLVDLGVSDVVSGGVEVPGSVLQTNSTTYVRLRSGPLALTSGNRFTVQARTSNATYYVWLNAARIVVVDNVAAGWTTGEEQVNMQNAGTYTPASGDVWVTLTTSPIYKYETSPRDGSVATFFEVCLGCNTAGKTVRAKLREHSNPDLSDAGTDVPNSQINITPASADTPVRARSAQITLSNGKYYQELVTCATGGKTVQYTSAQVIIQQTGAITRTQLHKKISVWWSSTSAVFARTEQQVYLDEANLPVQMTFYFQVTHRVDAAGTTGESRLYNVDDAAAVSGSTISTTSTGTKWDRSGSLTVVDLRQYDSQYRRTAGSGTYYLRGSYLVINVSSAPPLAPLPATLTLLGVG